MPLIVHDVIRSQRSTISGVFVLALLPQVIAFAQQHPEPDVTQRGLAAPPTLGERILEERAIAEQAAREVLADEQAGIDVPLDEPGELPTHASVQASPELLGLASREPERLIGKMLVLDDGTTAVEVGPVLDVRKRIADQEIHVIVDATRYFNSPTEYAVSLHDVDRLEGERLVTPEAAGMHLRGLDYYPEDYVAVDASSADVLARSVEAEAADEDATREGLTEERKPGEIPIGRF